MLTTCFYVKKKDDSPYSGHDVETWQHKMVTYRALRSFISIVLFDGGNSHIVVLTFASGLSWMMSKQVLTFKVHTRSDI